MKQKSRTEYSIMNVLVGMGGYILSVILSMVNRMVFTRCLPQTYLGISGLLTNVISMLSLAELGISGAIVYALYKPIAINDQKKISALVNLFGKAYRIIGGVIAVVGLSLLPFLKFIVGGQPDIKENISLIYVIYLFNAASSYFFTYRSTLLVAAQKGYLVTGLNYLVLCVQSIIQAIYIYNTRNYIGYLLIQAIFSLLYNIIISHIAVKEYPYIKNKDIEPLDEKERKRIFRDVKDLMYYKVAGVLVNSTDNIIITFFKGLTVTGLASNYILLTNTLNTLLNQVFSGITASVGNHNVLETDDKRYEMFEFLNMLNYWLFGWGALGIYFCCTDLVSVLFGKTYILSDNISLILALSFYVSGVANVITTYKHTLGLFHYGRFIQIITAIVNIITSLILGKIWGLAGVLVATIIARATTHLWYTPLVVYKYGFFKNIKEYVIQYLKYTLVFSIAFIGCKITLGFISFEGILGVIIKVFVCSLTTNIIYAILLCRTKEFSRLYQYSRRIMKRIGK